MSWIHMTSFQVAWSLLQNGWSGLVPNLATPEVLSGSLEHSLWHPPLESMVQFWDSDWKGPVAFFIKPWASAGPLATRPFWVSSPGHKEVLHHPYKPLADREGTQGHCLRLTDEAPSLPIACSYALCHVGCLCAEHLLDWGFQPS